jgi:hypothetical protein
MLLNMRNEGSIPFTRSSLPTLKNPQEIERFVKEPAKLLTPTANKSNRIHRFPRLSKSPSTSRISIGLLSRGYTHIGSTETATWIAKLPDVTKEKPVQQDSKQSKPSKESRDKR